MFKNVMEELIEIFKLIFKYLCIFLPLILSLVIFFVKWFSIGTRAIISLLLIFFYPEWIEILDGDE